MPAATCPACRVGLLSEHTPAGERWICAGCGGAAEGRAMFIAEAVDGAASTVSTPAPPGGRALPCPICAAPMGMARVDTDPPGGTEIGVCGACDLVWLDSNDRARIPLRLSPDRAAALESAADEAGEAVLVPPTQCPECGAPWALGDDLRCKFCGHQLVALVPRPE